jgi:hypothetical protein
MAGEARPSPAYYIALVLLVVGLLTGVALFLILASRPGSSSAPVEWSSIPTPCPSGTHGTSCYSFTVTNPGKDTVFTSCQLVPAAGTRATFEPSGTVQNFTLVSSGIKALLVTVVADPGSSVDAPTMSCPATPV